MPLGPGSMSNIHIKTNAAGLAAVFYIGLRNKRLYWRPVHRAHKTDICTRVRADPGRHRWWKTFMSHGPEWTLVDKRTRKLWIGLKITRLFHSHQTETIQMSYLFDWKVLLTLQWHKDKYHTRMSVLSSSVIQGHLFVHQETGLSSAGMCKEKNPVHI